MLSAKPGLFKYSCAHILLPGVYFLANLYFVHFVVFVLYTFVLLSSSSSRAFQTANGRYLIRFCGGVLNNVMRAHFSENMRISAFCFLSFYFFLFDIRKNIVNPFSVSLQVVFPYVSTVVFFG